jgi:hypothetical protein
MATTDKPGRVIQRNYQHASRIFVDGNYRLSPKYGFLFYVEFDFNPLITNVSNTSAQEMGMIVKSVNLPSFTMAVKEHNAYNRKNYVQNSIKYDPVTITFHDDQADNVLNFWYDYYSFYYRDSDYNDSTYQLINKYQERPSFEWGYTPKPVGSYNAANAYQTYQYIQAIRIYSLYQKQFDEYELVNPIITSFKHGQHANGDNVNLLEHQMSIQFETVKYYNGYTTASTAGGYIDLHYDTTPSPITAQENNLPAAATQAPANGNILDFAMRNATALGGAVVPAPGSTNLAAAVSAQTTAAIAAGTPSLTVTTSQGYLLPSLGTLTTGINNSAILSAQLYQATTQLAGTAAGTLAGGVVTGLQQGLGAQGTAVLGMATAAIANPSAAIATAENMATKFLVGAATSGVNRLTSQLATGLTNTVSQAAGDLNNSAGSLLFGSGTFTGGLVGSLNTLYTSTAASLDIATTTGLPTTTAVVQNLGYIEGP